MKRSIQPLFFMSVWIGCFDFGREFKLGIGRIMARIKNYPRVYVDTPLGQGTVVTLDQGQTHYLKNVMRLDVGDHVRLFNGQDGEWLYQINAVAKKAIQVSPIKCLRDQTESKQKRILVFAPLKKSETDMVIQKATELGVTDIYPVIMDHSNTHKVRADRLLANTREASEQSERLTLPILHNVMPLVEMIKLLNKKVKLYVALERSDAGVIDIQHKDGYAVIIGPEGGFSDDEFKMFKSDDRFAALSLGNTVLRAETAAIAALAVLNLKS